MHRTVALVLALTTVLASALLLAPSAGRAQSPEPLTTTVGLWLYPGWNFVGWLGEDGPVEDLFDQGAAVAAVHAPGPADPAAPLVTWEPLARGAERTIRTGEPLWIRIAGESVVRWQQDALLDPPVSALGAGRHAVVWSWAGGRPIGAVLGRVAEQLVQAQRWNSRTQAFQRYAADGDGMDRWGFRVRRGEALYLQLDAPAVWGPPEGPTITNAAWLPETDQRTLEQTVADVHAYFERWLGITPHPFQVHVQAFPFPCLTGGGTYLAILYLPCLHIPLDQMAGSTVAESYAAAAVLVTGPEHPEPEWLVAGHAHYVYARWMDAAGLQPYWTFYRAMIGYTRATDLALDGALLNAYPNERPHWESSRQEFQRWMSALAIDWLVQWTGEAALEHYAQTRSAGDWRDAFQDAFGMTVDQFTDRFAYWRARVAPAGGDTPRLSRPLHSVVFFGPLTDERRAMVSAVETIVDFFERAYGLSAPAATFLLDADDATYPWVTRGRECGVARGALVHVVAACPFWSTIAHEYAHVLQFELGMGRAPPPEWLIEGAAEYLATQAALGTGRWDVETAWAFREEHAAGLIAPAPAALSDAGLAVAAIERSDRYHVYTLAVRHLVERFGIGIDTLFAAFTWPTWHDAGADDAGRFAAVFGVSLDDFYASFGRWLRSLAAPPPPDPDEPQACPIAWADAQGTKRVDLLAPGPGCTVVRNGGTVTVSRGDIARTFTLYREYDWLLHDYTAFYGTAAVAFIVADPSGVPRIGKITLALGDGRELERDVPPEFPELHTIFDAITSAPGEPGE